MRRFPVTAMALVSAAWAQAKTLEMKAAFDSRYWLQGAKAYLYVELKGAKDPGEASRVPLNLSLVLDRSGSMESGDKLGYLKQACDALINNLKATDYLSVVAYSTEVEVLQKSAPLERKEAIRSRIHALTPTSSTNLSGGMLQGFREARATRREKTVNRVLLLSDGLANEGVTDVGRLREIVKARYKEDGIALSTFGLGEDYNEDLMTALAESGKGNYWFIARPDGISEIFRKELQGLVSVVAQNAKLIIQLPDASLKVSRVFGYEYEKAGNDIIVDFNDVFSEETKAVLVELDLGAGAPKRTLSARLAYDDVLGSFASRTEQVQVAIERTADPAAHEAGKDQVVQRNILLFQSVDDFEQALRHVDNREYEKARAKLRSTKARMDARFKTLKPDSALARQYELNDRYEQGLDSLKKASEIDFRRIQKSGKSANYRSLKKK